MRERCSKKVNACVSELGFGGWQLGNKDYWGDMSFEEGVALVKKAYANGITFYDTAPGYSSGMSEEILGEALRDVRANVFINTKFGDNSKGLAGFGENLILSSLKESMTRLQTDYIDSVLLHNPPHDLLLGKTNHQEVFHDLKKQGIIHGFGVSIDTLEEFRMVLDHLDVDVIEVMFNINAQGPKDLFKEANDRGIMIVCKIPYDSGWLTGKYDEHSVFSGVRSRWSEEQIQTRASVISSIKDIVRREDLVPVALRFILSFHEVTTVIPGVKNHEQLRSNLSALNYVLEEETKIQLEELYESYIKNLNLPW